MPLWSILMLILALVKWLLQQSFPQTYSSLQGFLEERGGTSSIAAWDELYNNIEIWLFLWSLAVKPVKAKTLQLFQVLKARSTQFSALPPVLLWNQWNNNKSTKHGHFKRRFTLTSRKLHWCVAWRRLHMVFTHGVYRWCLLKSIARIVRIAPRASWPSTTRSQQVPSSRPKVQLWWPLRGTAFTQLMHLSKTQIGFEWLGNDLEMTWKWLCSHWPYLTVFWSQEFQTSKALLQENVAVCA